MSKRAVSPRAIANRIVTHVTEVSISLVPDEETLKGRRAKDEALSPAAVFDTGTRLAEHYARVATMIELLERHGFVLRAGKGAVICTSTEMEAGEAKRLLLGAGFADREFQIVLEYTRGWGML
jgi:hypothetical protein